MTLIPAAGMFWRDLGNAERQREVVQYHTANRVENTNRYLAANENLYLQVMSISHDMRERRY